jgi:hypothetical protein
VPTAVPIDPLKLVEAARDFATHSRGRGRPRPVWLRRAVSTAYYALYHCICREAANSLLPRGNAAQRLSLARAFRHNDLKIVCGWIAGRSGNIDRSVKPLAESLKRTPIADVAASLWDLQEARHGADYDHLASFSKATVAAYVDDAEKAIQTLGAASARQRQAFFSLLAVGINLRGSA